MHPSKKLAIAATFTAGTVEKCPYIDARLKVASDIPTTFFKHPPRQFKSQRVALYHFDLSRVVGYVNAI
jgi:hypothetical protein